MLLRDGIDVLPRVAHDTLRRRGMNPLGRSNANDRRTAVATCSVLLRIAPVLPIHEPLLEFILRFRINRRGFMLCRVVSELLEEFETLLHQIQRFFS